MKLVLFGFTGGIGRCLLDQAVAAGHDVTAVARRPEPHEGRVRTAAADLTTAGAADLEPIIHGTDAVLSTIGPRSRAELGVAAAGTRVITEAMTRAGVSRIVVVSAAPVSTVPSPGRPVPPRHDPGDDLLTRYVLTPLVKAALRDHYADLAVMEDVLSQAGVDWTVIRPPRLTNGPRTGTYRVATETNLRRGLSISRADCADLMLRVLDQPDTVREAVRIAS